MATEKQIKACRENSKKSTGPKTKEGKAICAMNAAKTGEYLVDFNKLDGRYSGKLKICDICGDSQREECKKAEKCLLWEEMVLRYIKTHSTGNLKYVERIAIPQVATMDMLFTQRLRYAQIHMFETEIIIDKNGNEIEKQIIDNEYMYALMNQMNHLSKTMKDMKLTKATQDVIEEDWVKLLEAEIDLTEAVKYKNKILVEMDKWRGAHTDAKKMEELDQAILEHRQSEHKEGDDKNNINNISKLPSNPFTGAYGK